MSLESTLGKNIKEAREKAHLTQEELGKAFGKSKWTVLRIEQGKAEPSYAELRKIAQALGVTADILMTQKRLSDFIPGSDVSSNDLMSTENAPADQKVSEGKNGRRIISMGDWIKVPIVSREWTACCGTGISAADLTNMDEGFVLVDRSRFYRFDDLRRPYAIYCEGDCLESAGIFDGYLAIINPAEEPQNGTIVLVALAGSLSLKRFYATPSGDVILRSDYGQTRLTPDEMERDEFAVCGVLADVHQGRPKAVPL